MKVTLYHSPSHPTNIKATGVSHMLPPTLQNVPKRDDMVCSYISAGYINVPTRRFDRTDSDWIFTACLDKYPVIRIFIALCTMVFLYRWTITCSDEVRMCQVGWYQFSILLAYYTGMVLLAKPSWRRFQLIKIFKCWLTSVDILWLRVSTISHEIDCFVFRRWARLNMEEKLSIWVDL